MTLDNEQEAWREAVRAFRLAATTFKDPAPALLADLSAEGSLRDLTPELPLVSFSPFDALPDGGPARPDEQPHPPGSGSGQALDLATGAAPAGASRAAGAPRSPWDLPVAPQDDESAVRPPVFSFRRSGPAPERRASRRNQGAEEDEPTPYAGRLPSPTPEDRRWEARLEPPGTAYPSSGIDSREADEHAPGEPGLPHPMALLNSLANGFLEVAGDRDPELSVPGSGDSPEPNREAYGDSAIALIDSLAEHLLSPQVRTVGGLAAKAPAVPTGANTTGHLEEATTPERSPFAPLDSGRGEPIGRLTTGPKPSDTNEEVPGVAFDRYVDAETFASLVNDVLVEQARRHGVDLS